MRFAIGAGVLLAQVVMIGAARVHPIRFYTWAPYDSQNEYRMSIAVRGSALSADEVFERYRIPAVGLSPRSIYEVVSLAEYVERHYRPEDRAEVEIRYRTNGGPEQLWRWPAR